MEQHKAQNKRSNLRGCHKIAVRGILAALIAGALPLVYAVLIEPSWLQVNHIDIVILGLPEELEGLTIAQFSDPHIGSGIGERVFERAIKAVNEQDIDVAVFTGDFYDGDAYSDPEGYAERFATLAASVQSRHGQYAVLGNHDHWLNAAIMSDAIQDAGITLLDDDAARVDVNGQGLWVLGVDDTGIGMCPGKLSAEMQFTPHINAIRERLEDIPTDELRFLLAHNPDIAMWMEGMHINFVLSGHTHGGHIKPPFIEIPLGISCFPRIMDQGWGVDSPLPVYVNRGLGGMRLRFGSRPELTIFHLSGDSPNS